VPYGLKAVPRTENRRYWPTRWQIPLGPPTSLDLGHFELAGETVA
jgi:hypothetical protein